MSLPDTNLSDGTVLKLYVKDTKPPKFKRFIIIGSSSDKISLATVYINTDINENINWSIEQKELQLEISPEGRDYIDRTCYIDCSQIIIKNSDELKEAIKKRPEAVIGKLSPEDLEIVKDKIRSAITIKGKIKKRYGFYNN